jgi:hypothetical protein
VQQLRTAGYQKVRVLVASDDAPQQQQISTVCEFPTDAVLPFPLQDALSASDLVLPLMHECSVGFERYELQHLPRVFTVVVMASDLVTGSDPVTGSDLVTRSDPGLGSDPVMSEEQQQCHILAVLPLLLAPQAIYDELQGLTSAMLSAGMEPSEAYQGCLTPLIQDLSLLMKGCTLLRATAASTTTSTSSTCGRNCECLQQQAGFYNAMLHQVSSALLLYFHEHGMANCEQLIQGLGH